MAGRTCSKCPGKRTTGTGAQTYAITGPGWKGKLPAGVKEYKSPTALVWLLGRIYCTGTPEDYAAVHKLQDEISARPAQLLRQALHAAAGQGGPVHRHENRRARAGQRTQRRRVFQSAGQIDEGQSARPPPTSPCSPRWPSSASFPANRSTAANSARLAKEAFSDGARRSPMRKSCCWLKEGIVAGDLQLEHGWVFTTKTGVYGVNYLQRALITAIGLGANRPQDAVYPTSEGPDVLGSYTGEKKYVMHFPKGQLPPAQGFWSLTMYDKDYFFVDNPLNRYSISARQNLKANADGSVDLYIQNESPGADKESNWLPAPKDKFILMMRLYWPKTTPPSILDGSWKIPEVKAVE